MFCMPIIQYLQGCGGSAPVIDVERAAGQKLGLTPEQFGEMKNDRTTRLSYRVTWARFYLKKQGYLESSKRGVSVLSEKGKNASASDIR